MKISRGASLDRFYLFKLFGWGVFLHRIHHSDPFGVYHSHPWNGLSIIFGTYREQFRDSAFSVWRRRGFNFVRAHRHHRTIVDKPVWTLFIHGPKCNQWSVVDVNSKTEVAAPWEGNQGFKNYAEALKNAQS